jgi:hypothetical protein
MMYGLKPFNGAEMRAYLDVLNEAPPAYNPKGVSLPAAPTTTPQLTDKDQQDYQSWSAADRTQRAVGTGQSDMYGSNDPRAKFNNPVNAFGAQDKDTDAIVARQQGIMRQSAGSPEREQQFINKSMADLETMANRKVRPDESVQEDELSELRRYVDMVEANETPPQAGVAPQTTAPQQPTTSKDDADYNRWATLDQSRRSSQYGHSQAQSSDDQPDWVAVGGKEDNDLVNRFATKASTVAGSPEREAQFKQRYQQDTNPENSTLKPDDSYAYSLKEEEDELSELRRYFDMVEANETPTGAGQFSTKQMGDGTKVSFNPVTGGKTVSGAGGTTNYNVAGQKTSSQTPSIKGFQQSTNYQTGEKTTTGQVGPVSISSTQRPDQSTVQTAEVPLGSDVTAKVARGIGFGGAGKDVQQDGNQVTGITTRTAQNPEGTTSSFVGKPTDQQLDQTVQEDDLDDKVTAQYNTPQAKAKSQAIDKAFASGDQKEFDRLGVQSPERIERDLQTMRAGEKAQDAAVQQSPSLVMREWMALCR